MLNFDNRRDSSHALESFVKWLQECERKCRIEVRRAVQIHLNAFTVACEIWWWSAHMRMNVDSTLFETRSFEAQRAEYYRFTVEFKTWWESSIVLVERSSWKTRFRHCNFILDHQNRFQNEAICNSRIECRWETSWCFQDYVRDKTSFRKETDRVEKFLIRLCKRWNRQSHIYIENERFSLNRHRAMFAPILHNLIKKQNDDHWEALDNRCCNNRFDSHREKAWFSDQVKSRRDACCKNWYRNFVW